MTVYPSTEPSGPTVSRKVSWIHSESSMIVEGELSWYLSEPLAVTALFYSILGPVRWLIGRDLLAEVAIKGKITEGIGDVVVSRLESAQIGVGSLLYLRLSSPDGQVVLRCPVHVCAEFLDATYRYVPGGCEEVDVDAAIGLLLACEDD